MEWFPQSNTFAKQFYFIYFFCYKSNNFVLKLKKKNARMKFRKTNLKLLTFDGFSKENLFRFVKLLNLVPNFLLLNVVLWFKNVFEKRIKTQIKKERFQIKAK